MNYTETHKTAAICLDDRSGLQLPTSKNRRKRLSRLLDSAFVSVINTICLTIALFSSGVVVLLDLPDEPVNSILDAILLTVIMYFVGEIVCRSWAQHSTYFLSFFFWMDVVGSVSMIFDVSFLLGHDASTMITLGMSLWMRATRIARTGIGSGRLLKPLWCLSKHFSAEGHNDEHLESPAKSLQYRLVHVLSTRVARLTMVLVFGIHFLTMFAYHVDDSSAASWTFQLEKAYSRSYRLLAEPDQYTADLFEASVLDMVEFYKQNSYSPLALVGYAEHVFIGGVWKSIPGEALISGSERIRRQNIIVHKVAECRLPRPHCRAGEKAGVQFDFTSTHQYDTLVHFGITIFIIACMILESLNLSSVIYNLVVEPMGRTMRSAKDLLQTFMESSSRDLRDEVASSGDDDTSEDEQDHQDEASMLQAMFQKIETSVRLSNVLLQRKSVDAEHMSEMPLEARGILNDMLHVTVRSETQISTDKVPNDSSALSVELPIDPPLLDSWGLNLLELHGNGLQCVAMHLMFDSDLGLQTGRKWCNMQNCREFLAEVCRGYNDNPYHNFTHACDVLASLARVLRTLQWNSWLVDIDVYGLLVAAIAHDIGHQGKTNQFLVERRDAVALQYNDKSPLENMHCAKLFEIITTKPKGDIFHKLDNAQFKQIRAVCIDAILHTDNDQHVHMVKEIQAVHVLTSEICSRQAKDPDEIRSDYAEKVLAKHMHLWLRAILHFADVSNPMKTFDMNLLWAARVVDEFFAQGDEEKRLGLPVGMLNDRDKINRAGAEHGFIVYLVSPLAMSITSVFPMCTPLASQMGSNLEEWLNKWEIAANPSENEIARRAEEVKKIQNQVQKAQELRRSVSRRQNSKRKTTESAKSQSSRESLIRKPSRVCHRHYWDDDLPYER
jgi:cAMP-specific phosphodiesterase 4